MSRSLHLSPDRAPLLHPSPRDLCLAKFTAILFQIELAQDVAFSLYENLAAIMAVCVAPFVTGYVAQIDVMNPFLQSQISELFQCLYGRWRQPGQLILGKKPQKM
jgi:hypothetical protein